MGKALVINAPNAVVWAGIGALVVTVAPSFGLSLIAGAVIGAIAGGSNLAPQLVI